MNTKENTKENVQFVADRAHISEKKLQSKKRNEKGAYELSPG